MNRLKRLLIYILSTSFIVGLTFLLISSCLRAGYCVVAPVGSGISPIEAFGYAGLLVTVMAFVAAFSIVLMTIDALSISNVVQSNAKQVSENLDKLDGLKKGLSEAEDSLLKIRSYLNVLEYFVDEIDRSSEQDDDLYFAFEVVQGKLSLGDGVKKKLLESRQGLRLRRTRLNAIRAVVASVHSGDMNVDISHVIPELIAASKEGDPYSKKILNLLVESNLLSVSQAQLVEKRE